MKKSYHHKIQSSAPFFKCGKKNLKPKAKNVFDKPLKNIQKINLWSSYIRL